MAVERNAHPERRLPVTAALVIALLGVSIIAGTDLGAQERQGDNAQDDEWVCVPSATNASGWECGRGANTPEQRDPLPQQRPVTPEADRFLSRNPNQAMPSPGQRPQPIQVRPERSETADDESRRTASTPEFLTPLEGTPSEPEDTEPVTERSVETSPVASQTTPGSPIESGEDAETISNEQEQAVVTFAAPEEDDVEAEPAPPPTQRAPAEAVVSKPETSLSERPSETTETSAVPARREVRPTRPEPEASPADAAVTDTPSRQSTRTAATGSNDGYTIQLANLGKSEELGAFLARHQIDPGAVRTVAAAYPVGARYLVLWGRFDSWSKARSALNSIPGNGEIDGAWIRGFDGLSIIEDVMVDTSVQASPAPVTRTTPVDRPIAEPASYSDPVRSGDLEELMRADPNWYTVQLASMRERSSVDRFFSLHALSDQAIAVAKIRRDGGDWYLILFGAWPSLADARNAVAELPTGVQSERPWTRRLGPIQDAVIP